MNIFVRLGDCNDGTYELIEQSYPNISSSELEKLWVDYHKFEEYEQLIRLEHIPIYVSERIFEYTDKKFLAFRKYLQRDIEQYQSE